MDRNLKLGIQGEGIACHFLKEKGYKILSRNYRFERNEIDIIALDNTTIVFAEIKLRSHHFYGYPEEAVDEKKIASIQKVAEAYILENPSFKKIRFDIISIQKKSNKNTIYHIKDAF